MRKLIKILFISLLFIQSAGMTAQNLVPNPSFEIHSSCPDLGGIYKAIGWINFGYSPDLFTSAPCADSNYAGVPSNILGFQYAASGISYAGIFTYWEGVQDIREYIGAQLITPLEKNTKYFVSMKVSPGYVNTNLWAIGSIFTNNLGFLFTNYPLDSTNRVALNRYHVICNDIITDTTNWTIIKGSFVADSNYTYLVIGNLFDDASTLIDSSLAYLHPHYAYYYIDNVCVTSDSLFNENYIITGIENSNITDDKITIYPNPVTSVFSINNFPSNQILNMDIVSVYGNVVKSFDRNLIMLDISDLPDGFYLLKVYIENKQQIIKPLLKIK